MFKKISWDNFPYVWATLCICALILFFVITLSVAKYRVEVSKLEGNDISVIKLPKGEKLVNFSFDINSNIPLKITTRPRRVGEIFPEYYTIHEISTGWTTIDEQRNKPFPFIYIKETE